MKIGEVTVLPPLRWKTKKTCHRCWKNVKVHVTCFKCCNIYHAKCFLKVPTVYVNEKGHIFCCQNLTSKYNTIESKLKTQENENIKCKEDVCYDLENNGPEQKECEQDEYMSDAHFETKFLVDYVCSFCEVKFFEEDSYKQHIKLCEKNHMWLNKTRGVDLKFEKIYNCDKCSYMSKLQHQLTAHSKIHLCEKWLKCTFKRCKCTELSDTSWVKHCDCNMCEYTTVSKRNLRRHILRNHRNREKLHKCKDCMKVQQVDHICTHLGKSPFKCDMCMFATIDKKSLSKHILLKHSSLEEKYKCQYCEFSTHIEHVLKLHMIIHTNIKPFKCGKCEYLTSYKNQLNNHILAKHNFDDNYYICGMCGFATAFKGNLQRHIDRHINKEKQYKCNDCKYSTYRSDTLKKHMRIHTNQRQLWHMSM